MLPYRSIDYEGFLSSPSEKQRAMFEASDQARDENMFLSVHTRRLANQSLLFFREKRRVRLSAVVLLCCISSSSVFGRPRTQEINFHSLLALLSFGGAHEPELLKRTGSNVDDAAKFGLIGSHLSRYDV